MIETVIAVGNQHYQRGQVLFELRRFAEAEKEFSAALDGSLNDAQAHRQRAYCLHNLDRDVEGCRAAEQALELAPDDWLNHYALAFCLVHLSDQRGGHTTAENALEETLRMAPEDADTWSLMSLLRWKQRRYLEMLDAARIGLRHDPRHLYCLVYQVEALLSLNTLPEAERAAYEALAIHPDSPKTHSSLGNVLLKMGKEEPAKRAFLEALRIRPVDSSARGGLKRTRWWFRWVSPLSEEPIPLGEWKRPVDAPNIRLLISELSRENPGWGKRLVIQAMRRWERLPCHKRPRATNDIHSFERWLLYIPTISLIWFFALNAMFYATLPEGPLPTIHQFTLALIFMVGAFSVGGGQLVLRLCRWLERRVASSAWKQHSGFAK